MKMMKTKIIRKGIEMREIKFRAWYDDIEEMRYLQNRDFAITGDNKLLSRYGYSNNFVLIIEPNIILEQYTGLKDKNGVEIYEGDILYGDCDDTCCIYTNSVVYYFNGMYIVVEMFEHKNGFKDLTEVIDYHIELYEDLDKIEVIGNIHENGDLLK